jgi:SAM-dependent methyltransferase
MFVFKCNICGETSECRTGWLDRDAPTCTHCQSSVRFRSIVHLLTCELFGTSMTLADVPVLREIKGLGMTDWAGYAEPLAARFSYVNTYYHKEPQFDITNPGPEHTGQYDFVISTEVFEHIQAPVARAFENAARLLKPTGFLILTVPYTGLEDETKEHFPDLNAYRIIQLEDQFVLVNRRPDGVVETFTDLAFHGGPGTTLEMRLFAEKELVEKLLAAGFREVAVMRESYPEFGVQLPQPWSRPMVARRQRFAFPGMLVHELARAREEAYRAAQELRAIQDSTSGPATASDSEALQLRYSKLLEEHLIVAAAGGHGRALALVRPRTFLRHRPALRLIPIPPAAADRGLVQRQTGHRIHFPITAGSHRSN